MIVVSKAYWGSFFLISARILGIDTDLGSALLEGSWSAKCLMSWGKSLGFEGIYLIFLISSLKWAIMRLWDLAVIKLNKLTLLFTMWFMNSLTMKGWAYWALTLTNSLSFLRIRIRRFLSMAPLRSDIYAKASFIWRGVNPGISIFYVSRNLLKSSRLTISLVKSVLPVSSSDTLIFYSEITFYSPAITPAVTSDIAKCVTNVLKFIVWVYCCLSIWNVWLSNSRSWAVTRIPTGSNTARNCCWFRM